MSRMETLGLSESSARSDGRLKSLFWPSIQNGTDVDYLGTQGYWVCMIVAALSVRVAVVRRPANHRHGDAAVLLPRRLRGAGTKSLCRACRFADVRPGFASYSARSCANCHYRLAHFESEGDLDCIELEG